MANEKTMSCGREWKILLLLLSVTVIAVLAAAPFTAAAGFAEATGDSARAFGGFIGSNSFFNENQSTYEILGNVREYHPWGFTEWTLGWYEDETGATSESIKSMDPQPAFMNTWGIFDNYYKTMFEKGIELTICVNGTAGDRDRPDYQDADGTQSTVAASYLGHARSMFQLAARYGSNKDLDPALVRVAAGTEKRIGLGYVKYYENFNEPNLNGFSGAQFAAMLSADYDGHMGTMGPDAGLKAADPNAKMVMGGLAGVLFNETPYGNSDYEDLVFVEDMLAWFDNNRSLEQWKAAHGGAEQGYEKYPFDALSCHGYSTSSSSASGVSAEENHYFEITSSYVKKCRELFPGKEVYLSEFGWDTASDGYSIFRVTINGSVNTGLSGPEVQGRWLVRKYLLLAAAGVDRARQYMIPDTSADPNNPNWFATCGLVYGTQGSANFKPAWYYIGTMNHVLKDAALDDIEILADGGFTASGGYGGVETDGPWALKFTSLKNTDQIFALWLPTSLGDRGGSNRQNYTVTVPQGYRYATLITLKDKVRWGERTDISEGVEEGKLTVSIGEQPLFLVLSEEEYYNPTYDFIHPHSFSAWTLTQDSGDPSLLFEEQRTNLNTSPQPNMRKAWDPGGLHRYAVVDLGAKYSLSHLYVWDRDGALAAGKVLAIYGYLGDGAPGLPPDSMTGAEVQAMLEGAEWRRIAWFDFSSWEIWAEATVACETRYLILGFEDGPSEFYANPWPVDWLPVPEMIIKGALARGEAKPPDPPDPPARVFEPKPDETEYRFLFDNDFEDSLIKASTGGGTFEVIDALTARGVEGKILRAAAAGGKPEFTVPAQLLSSLEHGRWYYAEYKFMIESDNMAPELYLHPVGGEEGFYLYSSMGGNIFKPFWSYDSDAMAVKPGQWHQLKAKFMINSKEDISYEVFYDGDFISSRSGIYRRPLPIGGLSLIMAGAPYAEEIVYYYDEVWVYTRTPADPLLNASFDRLPLKTFRHGDDGLNMREVYSYESQIIQPQPTDPFYLGQGDQMFAATERSWLFDTTGSDILQDIKVGEDYVFELSFYYEDVGDNLTKTPYLLFLYDGWMNHPFAGTDWYGGLWLLEQSWNGVNDWSALRLNPAPGRWHRYAVKYRFDTETQITYSFYYDDMTWPIVTITLDSIIPGQMNYQADDLSSTMGFLVGAEGFGLSENPLYINDVLLYRGDIRPWPEKYNAVVSAPLFKAGGAVTYQPSSLPATVMLINSVNNTIHATTTNPDGAYTLIAPAAPAGARYTLKVTKLGYLSYTVTNFTLTPGEDITAIDISQLAGDVNGDGIVNSIDLTYLLSEFNRAPQMYPNADIDGDGIVNSVDLTYLLAGFNKRNVVTEMPEAGK